MRHTQSAILLLALSSSCHAASGYLWQTDSQTDYFLQSLSEPHNSNNPLLSYDDTHWQLQGQGDFNLDGNTDLLMHHTLTGENRIVFLNEWQQVAATHTLNFTNDAAWRVAGIADLNGDYYDDIVWYNQNSGCLYHYLINWDYDPKIKYQGEQGGCVSDTHWQIQAIADFDNNRHADILWRHTEYGTVYLHLTGEHGQRIARRVAQVSDLNWQIADVADYNGDLKADILWRHQTQGLNYVYLMDGSKVTDAQLSSIVPTNSGWSLVGHTKVNGDTTQDLLWQNSQTGILGAHLMQGASKSYQPLFDMQNAPVLTGYQNCPIETLYPLVDCSSDIATDCIGGDPIYVDCNHNMIPKRNLAADIAQLGGNWLNLDDKNSILSIDAQAQKITYNTPQVMSKCGAYVSEYQGNYQTAIWPHITVSWQITPITIQTDVEPNCIDTAIETDVILPVFNWSTIVDFTVNDARLTLIDRDGYTQSFDRAVTIQKTPIQQLEQQMADIIGDASCDSDTQCQSMPIGAMACGGPSNYLPYSTLDTDVATLQQLAQQHQTLSQQLLQGQIGICIVPMEPQLSCVEKRCVPL